MRHYLEVDDLSRDELVDVLDRSERPLEALGRPLEGRGMALYFEKPSLRTRHSAEMAVVQLGGHPITMRRDEIGPGSREPLDDIARVLAGYHALVGARVFEHAAVEALAAPDAVPVVNLLSELSHPVQTLADLLTMRQEWGSLAGRTLCWIGDYNNVGRSLSLGAALAGMDVRIIPHRDYQMDIRDLEKAVNRKTKRSQSHSCRM